MCFKAGFVFGPSLKSDVLVERKAAVDQKIHSNDKLFTTEKAEIY